MSWNILEVEIWILKLYVCAILLLSKKYNIQKRSTNNSTNNLFPIVLKDNFK